jgi:hypothetical protein
MATIEQYKKNRKRKLEDINIENEEEKLVNEEKNNSIFNNKTLKFEYDLKTKLDVCSYSETANINNTWLIIEHFKNKYPTLKEQVVRRWIKLGSQYFQSQIDQKGSQTKRVRKNTHGYFSKIELMLVEEILEREKKGWIRDSEWTRARAKELYEQHKQQFESNKEFDASQGWFYKFLDRHNDKLHLRKPTTNKQMSIYEYIIQWQQWILKERLFLTPIRQQIQSNQTIENIIFNIDEIPIVLESNKQRKQLGGVNNEMIQLKHAHMTRNPQYRSATFVAIIPADGVIRSWLKPLLLLPGREGPSKKTFDKRVLVYMNKKAWMSEAAWSFYMKEIKYLFKVCPINSGHVRKNVNLNVKHIIK